MPDVSYDVHARLYKEYNPLSRRHGKLRQQTSPAAKCLTAASSKQARSVIDGLPADVITMNMATDIYVCYEHGKLIPENWASRLPQTTAPLSLGHSADRAQGQPENIQDWPDLIKDGVEVIIPNPKTAGNGRYSYLSAWAYVLKNNGSEQDARDFVGKLFAHVPVMDTGGRGATSTFMQNQIGDVLLTFENEAVMIAREFDAGSFEVIYPSVSAEADRL